MNYSKLLKLKDENLSLKFSNKDKNLPSIYSPSSSGGNISLRSFSNKIELFYLRNFQKVQDFSAKITDGHCAYCNKHLIDLNTGRKIDDIEWDHILPASLGNVFTYGNVFLSCVECNQSKSNNEVFEWYKNRYDLLENPRYTLEEMETLLKDLKFLYYKEIPLIASIVNYNGFIEAEDMIKSKICINILDLLNIPVFSSVKKNSFNSCSMEIFDFFDKYKSKLEEENKMTENDYLAFNYLKNNFGRIESIEYIKKDDLYDLNLFLYFIDLHMSSLSKPTFNKTKTFINKIGKVAFNKNKILKNKTYSNRIRYIK